MIALREFRRKRPVMADSNPNVCKRCGTKLSVVLGWCRICAQKELAASVRVPEENEVRVMKPEDLRWRVKGYREGDSLTEKTIDAAMEDYLDDLAPFDAASRAKGLEPVLQDLGDIIVECWKPEVVTANPSWANDTLFGFLDQYFDGQMHPDSDTEDYVTPTMRAAAKRFVAVIVAEFVPWQVCLETSVTINALDWVRKHRPNWLVGGK